MFLAFSGSLIRAIAILHAGPSSPNQIGIAGWAESVAHQIGILLLLGYMLKRAGRTFGDIGFRWSPKEIFHGLWLYSAAFIFYKCGAFLINSVYHFFSGSYPHYIGARQIFGHLPLLALASWLLNPFYEEIVVRAYLMTEIRELTGSAILAALTSALLQTSYHIYYGWAGALSLGIQFATFAGYFVIWRRAFPLAIAHGLFDLVGFIRLR